MTKLLRRLTLIEGVAPGSTATIRLPIGRTYHQVFLELENITPSQVQNIEVQVNGVTIQKYASGGILNIMRRFDGLPIAENVLTFDFERAGLISMPNRVSTAIGTGVPSQNNAPTASVVQIVADIAPGVTNPRLTAHARTSGPQPLGILRKIREFHYNSPGEGVFEVDNLPRGDVIERIFLDLSNVALDSFELEMDGVKLFEGSPELYKHISDSGIRVPQNGWLIIDTSSDGFGDRLLNAVGSQDFRLRFDCQSAGQIKTIVSYLGAGLN